MNTIPCLLPAFLVFTNALRRWFGFAPRSAGSSTTEPDEFSPRQLLWGAWFTCALLAALAVLPRAHGQFSPATGTVNTAVTFAPAPRTQR